MTTSTASTIKNKLAPMADDEFWAAAEAIGWSRGASKERPGLVKARLIKAWTPEFAERFQSKMSSLEGALEKAIDAWQRKTNEHLSCGDDSFSDCMAHVIGLGRLVYAKTLADPSQFRDRLDAGKYVESFHYVVPYAADYERATMPAFAKFADRVTGDLVLLVGHPLTKNDEDIQAIGQTLLADLTHIKGCEMPTLMHSDVKAMLGTLSKRVDSIQRTLSVRICLPKDETTCHGDIRQFSPYGIENLYSDIEEAKEGGLL